MKSGHSKEFDSPNLDHNIGPSEEGSKRHSTNSFFTISNLCWRGSTSGLNRSNLSSLYVLTSNTCLQQVIHTDLLSRNVYNLKGISLPFNELPDGEINWRCTHYGFRTKAKFLCTLRNAYKLKR